MKKSDGRKNMKKMPMKKVTSVGVSSSSRKPAQKKKTYGVLKKTTTRVSKRK